MERIEKASIKIDTSFYSDLGRMSINTDESLKEFIDNSTTSFEDHRHELENIGEKVCKVHITWTDDEIIIWDNAYGMNKNDFHRALKLNSKSDNYSQNSRGQYGIGLKYAAVNLGKWYSIESTEYNSNERYYSVIDVEDLEKNSPDEVDLHVSETLPTEHGTKITIKNLLKKFSDFNNGKKNSDKLDKLITQLSKIYSKDLQYKRVELVINGRRVEYRKPEFMQNPETGAKYLTSFEGTFNVHGKEFSYNGWVGFLKKADVSNAGFTLLQKDRAIQLNYRPEKLFGKSNSFPYQRIIGEINLDGDNWVVTFTKTGMKWDDNGQEDAFIKSIYENNEIMAIFKEAKDYRVRKENVSKTDVGKMDLGSSFKSLSGVTKPVVEDKPKKNMFSFLKKNNENKEIEVVSQDSNSVEETEHIDITFEGVDYQFFIEPSIDGEMQQKWIKLKVKDLSKRQYTLLINSRVSMFDEFTSKETKKLIVKMAIVVSLAQLSSRRLGVSADESQKFVDQLNNILVNAK